MNKKAKVTDLRVGVFREGPVIDFHIIPQRTPLWTVSTPKVPEKEQEKNNQKILGYQSKRRG